LDALHRRVSLIFSEVELVYFRLLQFLTPHITKTRIIVILCSKTGAFPLDPVKSVENTDYNPKQFLIKRQAILNIYEFVQESYDQSSGAMSVIDRPRISINIFLQIIMFNFYYKYCIQKDIQRCSTHFNVYDLRKSYVLWIFLGKRRSSSMQFWHCGSLQDPYASMPELGFKVMNT